MQYGQVVDVTDFGAVAAALNTTGYIASGSTALTVASAAGWRVNAGIGIQGAGASGAPLATTVLSISGNVLTLASAASTTISSGSPTAVASDDRPAIQSAIDSLGAMGGTVWFPAGTYQLGVPNSATNKPILVGSNITLRGAGQGATVLRLSDEQNQTSSYQTTASAGMIFNKGNSWWQGTSPLPATDTKILVEKMTLYGNAEGQSRIFAKGNRTNGAVPDPTWRGISGQPMNLGGSLLPSTQYTIYTSYTDGSGNETRATYYAQVTTGASDNVVRVSLTTTPSGASQLVQYVRKYGDPTNAYGVELYERKAPIAIPGGGTVDISSHAAGSAIPPTGEIAGNGQATGSLGFYFDNASGITVRDVEITDFVVDGFLLQSGQSLALSVTDSVFEDVYSHGNHRGGGGITGNVERARFINCVFDANNWGFDMEPGSALAYVVRDVQFLNCRFSNSTTPGCMGVQVSPQTVPWENIKFLGCSFISNLVHAQARSGATGKMLHGLAFIGCLFKSSWSTAMTMEVPGEGSIIDCEFFENGQTPSSPPTFNPSAGNGNHIVFENATSNWLVTGCYFQPVNGTSAAAVDVRGDNGSNQPSGHVFLGNTYNAPGGYSGGGIGYFIACTMGNSIARHVFQANRGNGVIYDASRSWQSTMTTALGGLVQSFPSTKTANYAMNSADGYVPVDTSGGALTMTLPSPAVAGAGWAVAIIDKGFAAATNAITLARNGSEKINNVAANYVITTNGAWLEVVTNGTDWFVRNPRQQSHPAAKTAAYNIVDSDAYVPVDTSGGAVTVTLPSPSSVGRGWSVQVVDEGFNAGVNGITVARNGAEKINNVAGNYAMGVSGGWKEFVTNGTDWFVR